MRKQIWSCVIGSVGRIKVGILNYGERDTESVGMYKSVDFATVIKLLLLTKTQNNKSRASCCSEEQQLYSEIQLTQKVMNQFSPKEPSYSLDNSSLFYTKRGWSVTCCKLLGTTILSPCSCTCRSGHSVLINLHKNKCDSLFCNLNIYIYIYLRYS